MSWLIYGVGAKNAAAQTQTLPPHTTPMAPTIQAHHFGPAQTVAAQVAVAEMQRMQISFIS